MLHSYSFLHINIFGSIVMLHSYSFLYIIILGSIGMLHSYVNLVDRSDDEDKPALPARRNALTNFQNNLIAQF